MFEIKSEKSKTETVEVSKIENLAEKIASPESLAEQKISEMQDGVTKLERDGINQVGDASNLVGLDAKNALEIRASLGVDEKLSGIAERAKKLLEKTMKRMVVVGMAAVAFYGIPGEHNEFSDDLSSNSKTIELLKTQQESLKSKQKDKAIIMDEEQKMLIGIMLEALKQIEESEIKKAEAEILKRMKNDPVMNADKIKNELKSHIGSHEYLDRLTKETDGDRQQAEKIQKDRLSYLGSVSSFFVNDVNRRYVAIGLIRDEFTPFIPQWIIKKKITDELGENAAVGGFYNYSGHKIFLPNERNDEIARHELLHASTKNNFSTTKKAEKVLADSYKSLGDDKKDAYLFDYSEVLVRKQQLDYEMEKLGIKKYGEKFTKKHYDKLMDLNKKGELSSDAQEFIKITKPEYFEKIFNEIADNEKSNDVVSNNIA